MTGAFVLFNRPCYHDINERNQFLRNKFTFAIGDALSWISLATERAPPLSNSLHTSYLASVCFVLLC